MLLIVIAALCVAVIPATGGRLRRLEAVQLRLAPLAAMALVTQIIITEVWTSGNSDVHGALQLASYVLGGVFVGANLSIPGIPIMALGAALNLTAIAANAGVMPASRWAVARSGLTLGRGFSNSAPVAHPHLLWLGDIIPVPAGPLANVLSVGDLLIFAGLLLLLQRACGRRAPNRSFRTVSGARPSRPRPEAVADTVPVTSRPCRSSIPTDEVARASSMQTEDEGTPMSADVRLGLCSARWGRGVPRRAHP